MTESPVAFAQGVAPSHWQWLPLKRIAAINAEVLAEGTDPDLSFRYIEGTAVQPDGSFNELPEFRFEVAPTRARRVVRAGDVIVATVRPYLRTVAQVPDGNERFIASTGFIVFQAAEQVLPRYLYWWARSDPLAGELVARSVGVGYPAVSPDEVATLAAPVPPIPQQLAIANFLDRETARIDGLLAARRHLLRLVQGRKRALADALVGAAATLARVKSVVHGITSGPRGWAGYVSDEGDPFVRITNVSRESIELSADGLIRVAAPRVPKLSGR